MRFPTWFRITWWVVMTVVVGYLLFCRLRAVSAGQSSLIDVFLILVFVALLLAPIFQEASFFSLKFKQAVDDLRKDISTQLTVLRADIQTSINNTSNVNITVPSPPSDEQLPDLKGQIKAAVSETLRELGVTGQRMPSSPAPQVDSDTLFLFETRYTIEQKLRSIAAVHADFSGRRPPSVGELTGILVTHEVINPKLAQAIRSVYSVCSPAIHGEKTSAAQVALIRDVAQEVVAALAETERRTIGSPAD